MTPIRERGVRVVVFDTNVSSRHFVCSLLNTVGCADVVGTGTPEETFAALEAEKTHVLIVDFKTQPQDAPEFVTALRHSNLGRIVYIPVIVIAARADRVAVSRARNAGINEFMAKPISASSLEARLLAVLDAPRPFVRTADYFGPDRRRRKMDFAGPDRRKAGKPPQS